MPKEVIFMILFFFLFLTAFVYFASKLAQWAEEKAAWKRPVVSGLQPATAEQVALFRRYYSHTGMSIHSKRFKSELERVAANLYAAEGVVKNVKKDLSDSGSGDSYYLEVNGMTILASEGIKYGTLIGDPVCLFYEKNGERYIYRYTVNIR